MNIVTKIALIITLTYCSLATYELLSMPRSFKVSHYSDFPEWLETLLLPGYFLGFILREGIDIGIWGVIIGQIITFIILFFITKVILNSIVIVFEKTKN